MRPKEFSKTQSLCWKCANAVPDGKHGCSWSRFLRPVKGWKAKRSHGAQGSYRVLECPKFEPDEVPSNVSVRTLEIPNEPEDFKVGGYG